MANVANALSSQITNRNFLSTGGFKFVLNRIPKVTFFSNEAEIPSLDLGVATQPTYLKDIDLPGDKIRFGDFRLRFLVDENLENYMQVQKWIRGLGYPESLKEIFDLQDEPTGVKNQQSTFENVYSDGTLVVLNSSYNPQFKVVFEDMFPYVLSSLSFNAQETDTQYFTAEVSFKYTIYYITDMKGNRL